MLLGLNISCYKGILSRSVIGVVFQFWRDAALALAVVDPEDDGGHCNDYQGDACQFVDALETEGQYAEEQRQAVEEVTDLFSVQASRQQAIVQVGGGVVVGGRGAAAYAHEDDHRDIQDGDAQDHQSERHFGAANDGEHGKTQAEKLRAAIAHKYLRRIPVMRQEAQ